MIRSISLGMAMLALSATSAAAQDAAEPPLKPSGKWVANFADSMCTLSRTYGADKQALQFGLVASPGNRYVEILLVLPVFGSRVQRAGPATVELLPSGHKAEAKLSEYSVRGARLARFFIERKDMGDLAAAQSIRLTWRSPRSPVHLTLANTAAALRTLGVCTDDLARAWGHDPALLHRIATPAAPVGEPSDWIGDKDYPRSALMEGDSGITRMHWTVDVQGRVIDCAVVQTSGSKALDDTVCRLLQQRGRYTPAVDVDGKQVPSLLSSAVRWTIAQ